MRCLVDSLEFGSIIRFGGVSYDRRKRRPVNYVEEVEKSKGSGGGRGYDSRQAKRLNHVPTRPGVKSELPGQYDPGLPE